MTLRFHYCSFPVIQKTLSGIRIQVSRCLALTIFLSLFLNVPRAVDEGVVQEVYQLEIDIHVL